MWFCFMLNKNETGVVGRDEETSFDTNKMSEGMEAR